MTLYITGGHLTPALAVIDEIQKNYPKVKIRFIGREYSQNDGQQQSKEREEIEKRDIPFFAIDAAKFHRTHFLKNGVELLKVLPSFLEVWKLFRQKKPDVLLSFGGYIAIPACIVAKSFHATIILHEQTTVAGLANQVLSVLADKIAVANESSLPFFPAHKTVVTGNPIRESLFREYKTPPEWLGQIVVDRPLLYVTGGSQGSQIINQALSQILPKLVPDFVIVHQCGTSPDHHYQKTLELEREKLPEELKQNYIVREWIEAKEVSFLFRNAQFVISRAGANTVQELTLVGTPAIYIPLAFAYQDEQYKNIEKLIDSNASLLLAQKDLLPETLYESIMKMLREYEEIKKNMRIAEESFPKNGTKNLLALVFEKENEK